MKTGETVFEKTYKNYLEQLSEISFESIAHKLGAEIKGKRLKIQLLRNIYEVSHDKIVDLQVKNLHMIFVLFYLSIFYYAQIYL